MTMTPIYADNGQWRDEVRVHAIQDFAA